MLAKRTVRFVAGCLAHVTYWMQVLADRFVPGLSQASYRFGDAASGFVFRGDSRDLPSAFSIGDETIDIVDDLAGFTGLPHEVVRANVMTHKHISFRSEWLATAEEMRKDRWFYLSSKAYLFGNASHFDESDPSICLIKEWAPEGSSVWDFGAGAGQLTMRLLALGYRVTASELNVLQLEFLRYRARVHAPATNQLRILHADDPDHPKECAAVVAMDVLEHLAESRAVLEEVILPSLKVGGVLIEDSPFVRNTSNPMHHTDFGLQALMEEHQFTIVAHGGGLLRVWRQAP